MSDFVRRELPQARERHLLHLGSSAGRGKRCPFLVRRQQSLRNQIILPHTQRTQRDLPFDDFSRTRIQHAHSVGPSSRRAVHPLNHVVAQSHHVRALRQQLHAERVFIACCFKRLVPPPRTLKQRGTDRLGRTAVQVV